MLGNLAQNVLATQATMNLGWVFDSADEQPYEKGVILHAFGHALGLAHEHLGFERLSASGKQCFCRLPSL